MIENLALIGFSDIDATGVTAFLAVPGGSPDNVLSGNSGRNVLDGRYGNDTLTGGNGSDTFVFGSFWGDQTRVIAAPLVDISIAHTTYGVDPGVTLITDFDVGMDLIRIKSAGRTDPFSAFTPESGPSAIDSTNIRILGRGIAQDINDYILYEEKGVWATGGRDLHGNLDGRNYGLLFYDRDGSGPEAAFHFATLLEHPQGQVPLIQLGISNFEIF